MGIEREKRRSERNSDDIKVRSRKERVSCREE
jgi:hypothetical protein